jgi:hypothetical protein
MKKMRKMMKKIRFLNYLRDRTTFGGADGGDQDAGRGSDRRTATHFALERSQFTRNTFLRFEGVLKITLGFAALSLFAAHLLLGLVQLAFKSLFERWTNEINDELVY